MFGHVREELIPANPFVRQTDKVLPTPQTDKGRGAVRTASAARRAGTRGHGDEPDCRHVVARRRGGCRGHVPGPSSAPATGARGSRAGFPNLPQLRKYPTRPVANSITKSKQNWSPLRPGGVLAGGLQAGADTWEFDPLTQITETVSVAL